MNISERAKKCFWNNIPRLGLGHHPFILDVFPFSSKNQYDCRLKVREHLVKTINLYTQDEEEIERLRLPGLRPRSRVGHLALSHCHLMGGFLLGLQKNVGLGFDVEIVQRISWKAVARISENDELISAPHPSFLWTAKEATFKCLPDNENCTLKDSLISQWSELSNNTYSFRFQKKKQEMIRGKGLSFLIGEVAFSFTFINLKQNTL